MVLLGGGLFFIFAWPTTNPADYTALVTLPAATTVPVSSTTPLDPTTTPQKNTTVLATVPFISQAPRAQWDDPIFQDGCEEASALMAMNWATGFPLTVTDATEEILQVIAFEKQQPSGYHEDLSIADTAALIRDYFHYSTIEIKNKVRAETLIEELEQGRIMVAAVNGQLLNNPYFKAPGPLYHMLVVIGYDPKRQEFITNDPGTRHGAHYRYPAATFMAALRDYPTGHHEPIIEKAKRVIVVSK